MIKRIALLVLIAAFAGVPLFAMNEQWIEVRSGHFTVVTDSNEKQARHIVDQFERMRWMFQTLFPKANVDPVSPILVIAAKNSKSFQALEPEAYVGKGQIRLGGLFLKAADRNYILLRQDAEFEHPYAAVYHEYTHLQFSGDGDWMPLWLNEGLAEFIQNTEIREKDVLVGEPSVEDILYLRQNQMIPLPVLFKVDTKSPYYHEENKGSVFYAESWALTHYLYITDREKGTHRATEYLGLVSRNEDPVAAAEKAFGDLKQLQKELELYVHASTYKQFVLSSAAAPLDESSCTVRALSQSDADAIRADFLANVQRDNDARAMLDAVLKADPKNVQARETQASIAMRGGDREAAQKLYAEAVELGSQNYLTHYYFASLSMGQGGTDESRQVEDSLRAAIRLNPRFLPSYDQLAARLSGWERYADARAVLEDWLKAAGSSGEARSVHQRIAQIDGILAMRAHAAARSEEKPDAQQNATVVDIVTGPKHPDEPPAGPRHNAEGVMRNVQCTYPSAIEFQVANDKKTVVVYHNNYLKLDITALGFTPPEHMTPCSDFEGMRARIQYAESSDKTVDGQVVAIELRK